MQVSGVPLRIEISWNAPYHQRNRYENTTTMKSSDPNLQAGPMCKSEDYKATTKLLLSLREEKGKAITCFPKKKRTRHRNVLDTKLQQRLEWLSQTWRTYFSTTSSSSSSRSHSWWRETQWQVDRWNDQARYFVERSMVTSE